MPPLGSQLYTPRVGDLSESDVNAVEGLLNEFAERVISRLNSLGFQKFDSPLWRRWHVIVVYGAERIYAAFSSHTGGASDQYWLDYRSKNATPESVTEAAQSQLGRKVDAFITLPWPTAIDKDALLDLAVARHIEEVQHAKRLDKLGDWSHVKHLEPKILEFMDEHPDFDKNVFIMMRFLDGSQFDATYNAIKSNLMANGFNAVRADGRKYSDDLWENIEVYLTGSKFGIAVFEIFEDGRGFNPNVSLELGYMLRSGKRVLILKEKTIPQLAADVLHKLYSPFDKLDLEGSLSREILHWITVDLHLGA